MKGLCAVSPFRTESKCWLHMGDGLGNRCLSTSFNVVMTAVGKPKPETLRGHQ